MIDQEKLKIILEKCGEYCEKLEKVSLYFICKEEIKEVINSLYSLKQTRLDLEISRRFPASKEELPVSTKRNVYVYDYQLIRQGNAIDERRNLIKENNRKKNIIDAQLKTRRFNHKYVILGPIGLLGREQQKNYDYKILKEVNYKREKAVVLEASPKFMEENNTLYGKIWIRNKDFNILKIEWEKESLENFEEIEKIAKALNAKPRIIFFSEYAFEKNEIMFPSKYSIEEIYILPGGYRYSRSKTTIIYDNYKFFTVDTKVKY